MEVQQNRLGFFDDNKSFLVDYFSENESYFRAKDHNFILEKTENLFIENWDKVFQAPPPKNYSFKSLSRNIKSLPLFTPLPNSNTVRFNPPKRGLKKYDIAITMLYNGLFDFSGLSTKTTKDRLPNYPGRSNGWKTYLATLGEQLGVKGDVRYEWARDSWVHKNLLLGMCDIVFNFNKWDMAQVKKYYHGKSVSAQELTREEIRNLINKPGYYLSHAMGYIKTTDLKKQMSSSQRDRFSLSEFHKRASKGYYPYDVIDINSNIE